MDTGRVLVILITGNILGLGLSDNLASLYSPGPEYVDIDEGAIVKVEFSKTLRWFNKLGLCRPPSRSRG